MITGAKSRQARTPGQRLARYYPLLLACVLAGGCESLGVEAWQRETLSRPEMQFSENDMDLLLDDHFYFSKEGTSGGRGFAGGGCGCN